MEAELRAQLIFRATGKRSGTLESVKFPELGPALFAGFRDLAKLRYDFPLVMVSEGQNQPWVCSLTDIVDRILQTTAPRGPGGERVRRHVLRLEQEIRGQLAGRACRRLSTLWDEAAAALAAKSNEDYGDSLGRARGALDVDGEVVDCDAAMPGRLFTHAWRLAQQRKLQALAARTERLASVLSDVLAADFARSESGRSAAALAAAVGPAFAGEFDFAAMARMVGSAASKGSLPDARRRRIERTLEVLRAQPALSAAHRGDPAAALREFEFDDADAALAALRARLPAAVELIKALAVAALEIEGRYVEAEHDAFFESFDKTSLGPDDLALLPDALIRIRLSGGPLERQAGIAAVLSSGLPVKVLVQIDDILGEPGAEGGPFTFAAARLGVMAVGLPDVYVLQASAAGLYEMRERIERGMAFPGAALFSVFTGAGANGRPPYLLSAAAMQARVFPAFSYDPSAGADLASRFSLDGNPQPEADWPTHGFTYEDAAHRRIADKIAFTPVDFVASDPRYAGHFVSVPAAAANGAMVAVREWLDADRAAVAGKVPYIVMADDENRMHRPIVDEALMEAAQRCRSLWRHLQELGGIRNSHAERLLAKERRTRDEQAQREAKAAGAGASAPAAPSAPPPPAATAAPAAAAEAAPDAARPPGEPYIETLRCTSCNECIQINGRMFAYDANKQAYIADLSAGTYRELVEAAESCQVSIIHPGKPRNPNEPQLEELLARAEPFQ